MTADLYCARGDVNRWIPAGAIAMTGQLVESALAATDSITLDGHGFETDDPMTVRATTGGSLPAPLVADTTYYAIRISNAEFKLAAAASGSAIDLTTDGVSVLVMREPPYDDVIEFYSRWVDSFMPAHAVPFPSDAIPALVKGIVAELSAKKLMNLDGKTSEIVNAAELANKAMLERFALGLPLRGTAVPASTNIAVTDTLATTADARGWGSGTLP